MGFCGRWLGYTLIGVALLRIDFFGLSDYVARRSQDLFMGVVLGQSHASIARRDEAEWLWGLFTSEQPGGNEFVGRDRVSVVMVDDDTLRAWPPKKENVGAAPGLANVAAHATWPLTYGRHARVLEQILSYGPSAVLVDILFIDERNDPSIKRLISTLDRYEKHKVPVYLAANHLNLEAPIHSAIAAKFPAAGPKTEIQESKDKQNTWTKIHLVPVPTQFDADDLGVARKYATMVDPTVGRRSPAETGFWRGQNLRETAAFQIFKDLCRSEDGDCNLDRKIEDSSYLTLIYGTTVPAINKSWMVATREDGSVERCREQGSLLGRIYDALVDLENLFPSCPYIKEVPAEELGRQLDPDIEAAIRNRIVVYGVALIGMGDRHPTPLHGRQPGARIHAAALDNLFVYGPSYKIEDRTTTVFGDDLEIHSSMAIDIFVTMTIVFLSLYILRLTETRVDWSKRIIFVHICAWASCLLFLGVFGTALYWLADLTALNWIGSIGALVVIQLMYSWRLVEKLWNELGWCCAYLSEFFAKMMGQKL